MRAPPSVVAAMSHPPGEPRAARDEEQLADLLALADGSTWSYYASVGGFVSADDAHLDVICRDAAAVISHTGGNVRPVYRDQA